MTLQTPFRADYVGSFLRPEKLKNARHNFNTGKISQDALTEIENETIADLVKKQKSLGFHVITDGEFRRSTWHLDFMWSFSGVGHKRTEKGLPFHDETAMLDDTFLTGKVSLDEIHPFVEHFKFLKQFEDSETVAKLTIPAPAQFLEQMIMPFALENTKKIYTNTNDLVHDIAAGYKKFIHDVYAAGCRNLQFDDCSWGMLVDPRATQFFGTTPSGLKEIQELFLTINNLAIEGAPDALTINTHVCRGNFHSTYAASGEYSTVADVLFSRENVNAYYLEFDDERSGDFLPLAKVSNHKKVVLGLVTTKHPELEEKSKLIERIHDAAKYIPLEKICISPQCGFASCEIGNKLTEDDQWKKLQLVQEVAKEVWG